jgi:hypothetical protein
MTAVLDQELTTFEAHRAELLSRARDKYVLIKGDTVVDVFDTQIDAIHHGYERFGNVPFLVKQVVEFESPLNFSSNLLGV